VGIRAQGMAGAFVAAADDATASWWNPAGLAGGTFFIGVIEYDGHGTPGGAGGVAAGFPALALSYYRFQVSQMQAPSSTGAAASGRKDQRVLNQFGATVGQSLGDHLVIGSTLKVLSAGDTRGDLD